MKTGRDVVVAALLGAEEYGFATSPLIVSGCIMMRVCHLDTCPVGVATQNPVLRERFTGKPEFVVTFFEFIAEQVREILAVARVPLAGRGDRAGRRPRHREGDRALEGRRARPDARSWPCRRTRTGRRCNRSREQDHGLDAALDNTLIQLCEGALLDAAPVTLELPVRNVNRTVGTMLGSLVSRRYGADGLPPGTIDVTFRGSGGQSFGAFLPRGITMRLLGDTNDYAGKGLSGGVIVGASRRAGARSSPRTTSSPATSSPTARRPASSTCAASWGSGSACATPAPPSWPRAWATTRWST